MMWISILLLCAPQENQELRRGEETIQVRRDRWGIPHITAPSAEAAFWAEGYTEAEDRFQQMDRFRRGGRGESAEVSGPDAVESDMDRRFRGYTEDELRGMFEACGPRLRAFLEAYAGGVNTWIAEKKIESRPWRVTDSMIIGVMMARRFGEAGDDEMEIQEAHKIIEQVLGREKARVVLEDVWRLRDDAVPTTLNDHRREPVESKEQGFAPAAPVSGEWLARHRSEGDRIRAWREAEGLPVYFGSNAWVIAPSKSKSGNPMLYGGPMMGFGTPSICNELHLVAPGLNAAGMSFPGVPGVLIGFNERVAWTTTSGGSDLVDVYVLELNPENPDQYRYQGAWKDFEKLEQKIVVKGEDPRLITVLRSVYGPLAGDRDREHHRAYTLAMSFWKREGETIEGALEMQFATSVEDCARGASKISTSHNYFAADRDGHIGFWYCGRHPKRKAGHDVRFPQPGDGSMDWVGILPFEEWPKGTDPKNGFFCNWNNKPCRDWDFPGYGQIYWGRKIQAELEGSEKVDLQKVWQISRETAEDSFMAEYFLPHLLPLIEDAKLREGLEKWDRVWRAGEVGTELVKQWVERLIPKVFGKDLGLIAVHKRAKKYLTDPLLYLLQGDQSPVRLKYDWSVKSDLPRLMKEALAEVLKEGEEKLRFDPPTVNFGEKLGRVPSAKGRGTFQMAVELTPEGPVAWTLAAPGQSESEESPHFKDQLQFFEGWRYKEFEFH